VDLRRAATDVEARVQVGHDVREVLDEVAHGRFSLPQFEHHAVSSNDWSLNITVKCWPNR